MPLLLHSPLSASLGTPRIGPSIKVWDPYNVLAPPHPPLFSRISGAEHDRSAVKEVYFISHGECDLNIMPDLIGGRCQVVTLTPNGKRQARALAIFLNSEGIRFTSVFSLPLDRARSMAISVCQSIINLLSSDDATLPVYKDPIYDSTIGRFLTTVFASCSDVDVKLTAESLVLVFPHALQRTKSGELKAFLCSAYVSTLDTAMELARKRCGLVK